MRCKRGIAGEIERRPLDLKEFWEARKNKISDDKTTNINT